MRPVVVVGHHGGMSFAAASDEARQLLLAHTDRAVSGPLEDPALVAAVVGVERLVVVTGSTDPARLRQVIEGRPPEAEAVLAEAESHIVAGLERRSVGQSVDAGVVNPEAGSHHVVTDAELLRAAVRAGQRSYEAMPYYRARYGERGARFASSDSAWLVSLGTLDEEAALRQVAWLARLLASRGMPSWLLETHLDDLSDEIRAVDPSAVGPLSATASALAAARRRHVDDDLLVRADRWAAEALGADHPVARTGALIAAAVADDLSGLVRGDRYLVDWLLDAERLDAGAADALREVRTRIRAHAR
jgi:hypothetical protein